jgi:hypothetical protein
LVFFVHLWQKLKTSKQLAITSFETVPAHKSFLNAKAYDTTSQLINAIGTLYSAGMKSGITAAAYRMHLSLHTCAYQDGLDSVAQTP